jgi:hypothetical protein
VTTTILSVFPKPLQSGTPGHNWNFHRIGKVKRRSVAISA